MCVKRFVSWNVNGIRACVKKGFVEVFDAFDADAFCLQETKLQKGQIDLETKGYYQFWNYAEKKGYSGTAIFTKEKPLNHVYGLGIDELDKEGRIITLEYPEYYLITVYTPNAQEELRRIDFRMKWDDAFRSYVTNLDKNKPVIVCGDLNVAHKEIDLKNPGPNRGNAGFSDEERGKFNELLDSGFTDTFRYFYPDLEKAYSWWTYRFNARKNNAGWRIDYFLTSKELDKQLKDAKIHPEIYGSDHCPVEVEVEI
ncbi:MAG TPA: exodeoxyribonuclease III [Clostridia bacterium]|nr:exodeoxyribonuclease III [Clostridia bacterium]